MKTADRIAEQLWDSLHVIVAETVRDEVPEDDERPWERPRVMAKLEAEVWLRLQDKISEVC